jgi:hypothetical protein
MSCLGPSRSDGRESGTRGSALVIVLLAIVLLTALGTGMLSVATTDEMSAANERDARAMVYAAEGAVERAAAELAALSSWDAVLDGSIRSVSVDGPPSGSRTLPGGRVIVLESVASLASCGHASPCTTAEMDATSNERPWGANNPRWRLYSYGPVVAAGRTPGYWVVLAGDDPSEGDANPSRDAPAGAPGAGVISLRGEVFGPAGAHRVVEAVVVRAEVAGGIVAPRFVVWRELR